MYRIYLVGNQTWFFLNQLFIQCGGLESGNVIFITVYLLAIRY